MICFHLDIWQTLSEIISQQNQRVFPTGHVYFWPALQHTLQRDEPLMILRRGRAKVGGGGVETVNVYDKKEKKI